jgi:2-polyprenyl-6-methoxyphenol hydroxylase-like FAD-dependent oxidoreductase
MPEMDGWAQRHEVAIVGAGPVGMTAALRLARCGIERALIERRDTFDDGSRAICIAQPSMHIPERVGAVACGRGTYTACLTNDDASDLEESCACVAKALADLPPGMAGQGEQCRLRALSVVGSGSTERPKGKDALR